MARVLMTWELGEGLGHLARLASVVPALSACGHELFVALSDLSQAETFFAGRPVTLLQAPVWLRRLKQPRLTKTFADILHYKGYERPEELRALVRAWRGLFSQVQPDIILFDFAPTALLAARGLDIPRVIFSHSFAVPPPGQPPQDICPWVKGKDDLITFGESRVLDTINAVTGDLGIEPLQYVSDVNEVEAILLTDYPELDCFERTGAETRYIGPISTESTFAAPTWGTNSAPRVFAYLKPGRQHSEHTLQLLARLPVNCVCYYPGRLPPGINALQSPHFVISEQPLNVKLALEHADLVVCNGTNMVCESLARGCPVLVVPTQLEQTLIGRKVEALEVGWGLQRQETLGGIDYKLRALINDPTFRSKAQRLAHQWSSMTPATAIEGLCAQCEQLIGC